VAAQVYSASDERLQRAPSQSYNQPFKSALQPALEQKMPKHLLIVYHSKTGNTHALAQAAHEGATDDLIKAVDVRLLLAHASALATTAAARSGRFSASATAIRSIRCNNP
jgi:hypothetical protein